MNELSSIFGFKSFVEKATGKKPANLDEVLTKCGYETGDLNDEAKKRLEQAMSSGGEILSQKTGMMRLERSIPEEAPAFVGRPPKLKLGDKVQLLNWQSMGVHGATIDMFPQGKVTKMYVEKCLVGKCKRGYLPPGTIEKCEEERLHGVELDGRGPYSAKDADLAKGEADPAFPFLTKDSTVIVRMPALGEPSGQTAHKEPMII